MKKSPKYKGNDAARASKNSPKVSGDAKGDAYKVKESYTNVGAPERIPSSSKASDSYGNAKY